MNLVWNPNEIDNYRRIGIGAGDRTLLWEFQGDKLFLIHHLCIHMQTLLRTCFAFALAVSSARTARADSTPTIPKRTAIAVLNFQIGKGVDPNIALLAAGRFRAHIVTIPKYDLIDKANMNRILEEQKLALKMCTRDDANCVISVGKQLAVREIVVGKINRLGEKYVLLIEHTDTETAKVKNSFSSVCACSDDQLLDQVDAVFAQFFLTKEAPVAQRVPTRNTLWWASGITFIAGAGISIAGYAQASSAVKDYEQPGIPPVS